MIPMKIQKACQYFLKKLISKDYKSILQKFLLDYVLHSHHLNHKCFQKFLLLEA